jgi:ribosomal protein S18 acetylase RimI-like enzyme
MISVYRRQNRKDRFDAATCAVEQTALFIFSRAPHSESGYSREAAKQGIFQMQIRNFTSADFPNILKIAHDAGNLAQHHPHVYWMMTYTSPHLCLLAEDNGLPLGYASGIAPFIDSQTCFLWQIGVIPAGRRRNVGTALAVEFFKHAHRAGSHRLVFTIQEDNAPSLELLSKVARIFGAGDLMRCIGTTGDMGASAVAENIYEVRFRHLSSASLE